MPVMPTSATGYRPLESSLIVGLRDGAWRSSLRDLHPGDLTMMFPTLNEKEAARWERELIESASYCGCGEAAVGLLVSVITALVMHLSAGEPALHWHTFVVALASGAAGAVVGKGLGIVRGERRYRRVVEGFERSVRQ